jgi:hypothetical protein
MVQYLNVCQIKLGGIIIIQTVSVHILQRDSADTGAPPLLEDFFKHNPNYFQITQAGSSSVTPPYQLIGTYQRATRWSLGLHRKIKKGLRFPIPAAGMSLNYSIPGQGGFG